MLFEKRKRKECLPQPASISCGGKTKDAKVKEEEEERKKKEEVRSVQSNRITDSAAKVTKATE